jgi:hypothetical protein
MKLSNAIKSYKNLDKRFKRCIIFDIFINSLIFIPYKYIFVKRNIIIYCFFLLYFVYSADGEDLNNIKIDDKFLLMNKKSRKIM